MIAATVYAQFFGLKRLPFRLRPDPDFLYSGAEFSRARASLLTGLKEPSRVVLLLGPPGVGKTMLLDNVLQISGAACFPCRINQPQISANELLEALLLQLGPASTEVLGAPSRSFAELTAQLSSIGNPSAMPLLIVDDAHLLPASTAELLPEIQARAPAVKIVLLARQDQGLEAKAAKFLVGQQPRTVHLSPLSKEEARAYIDHRLAVAGGAGRDLIAPEAYPVVFQQTAGSLRLTNLLCDSALHVACLRASGQVSASDVLQATQDPKWAEAVSRDRSGAGQPKEMVIHEPEARAAAVDGQAQLIVSLGNVKLSAWPVEAGRMTIGRALDNAICLEAKFISRHHCQITTVGSVSTVEDLNSVNGVSVNGKLVKHHLLKNGDNIQLGDHTLTYVVSD